MIESLRTTQIPFFRFATLCGFFRGSVACVLPPLPSKKSERSSFPIFLRAGAAVHRLGERRRGTESIRARVRARENHMKPFVKTSFLGTRPSCLPSPGMPFFAADDRKPILWLGHTGSPVNRNQTSKECSFANDLSLSGSSFIAGIHRFLRKNKTLSILTVPNLKIHKNPKISFRKVLRGKNSPKTDGQRGRGFIWTRLWTQTYFWSSLVTFRWSDMKQGDDRKYFLIGN